MANIVRALGPGPVGRRELAGTQPRFVQDHFLPGLHRPAARGRGGADSPDEGQYHHSIPHTWLPGDGSTAGAGGVHSIELSDFDCPRWATSSGERPRFPERRYRFGGSSNHEAVRAAGWQVTVPARTADDGRNYPC